MGLNLDYFDGQTPIDEEEREGLKILSIATRGELDEFEQNNIEQAVQWMMSRSFNISSILSEDFVRLLHKRIFSEVWSWAGEFRKSNKNIGVEYWQIPTQLRALLDDSAFWFEKETFTCDEFALRFKHRIVSIHCFPNGNGRHSRLFVDIINEKIFNQAPYSWGASSQLKDELVRQNYLKGIRAADQGDYKLLIDFARS